MQEELKKWVKENKLTAIVIGVLTLIVIGTTVKHLLTPRSIKIMPAGFHECIAKNGNLVYSKQPCMDDETMIANPADAKKAQ